MHRTMIRVFATSTVWFHLPQIHRAENSVPLETHLEDVGHISFLGNDGKTATIGEALPATNTDAFMVLRRGRIAVE